MNQTSQARAISKLAKSISNTGMGSLSAAALAVSFVLSEPEPLSALRAWGWVRTDRPNGCHWLPDGCCGQGRTELQEYTATDERPDYPEPIDPAQQLLPIDLPERPEPCAGVVWVDDERNGHCPDCGGLLHIAPWPCG